MGKGSEPEVKENEAIIVGEKVGVNVSDSGNQVTNVGDKPVRTSDDLFAAVRYGGFKSLDTVQNLLTDNPQFVNERGEFTSSREFNYHSYQYSTN